MRTPCSCMSICAQALCMVFLMHYIEKIVQDRKQGKNSGIYSACSANEYVIQACMENALKTGGHVLIEATANQVNQFGGYTGMKPADFYEFVVSIARSLDFPIDRLILGGDHLGPLTWVDKPEAEAMELSKTLINDFVLAGFTKIHIDTSMRVASDDPNAPLDTKVIAARGAILCKAAQEAYSQLIKTKPDAQYPVYIVGSEVPIPGGAQEHEGISVTTPADFKQTVSTFKAAFDALGLEQAWSRVCAVVVQPGVEFGDSSIDIYNRAAAKDLTVALKDYDSLVFEGHSTDYQTKAALKEMVEDGIAILKVGPALTFALREGIFALESIEKELLGCTGAQLSGFAKALEAEMLDKPGNWKKHYHGDDKQLYLARKYSFSDRARYYLPAPTVDSALARLFENLRDVEIPLTLLSQFMPVQYTKVREGALANEPKALVKDSVVNCVDEYMYALGD